METEHLIRSFYHGFSDEQWKDLKNTFPYSEIPFIITKSIIEFSKCKVCGVEIQIGDCVKAKVRGKGFIEGKVMYNSKYGIVAIHNQHGIPFGSNGSSTKYKPYNWTSYTSIEVLSQKSLISLHKGFDFKN